MPGSSILFPLAATPGNVFCCVPVATGRTASASSVSTISCAVTSASGNTSQKAALSSWKERLELFHGPRRQPAYHRRL